MRVRLWPHKRFVAKVAPSWAGDVDRFKEPIVVTGGYGVSRRVPNFLVSVGSVLCLGVSLALLASPGEAHGPGVDSVSLGVLADSAAPAPNGAPSVGAVVQLSRVNGPPTSRVSVSGSGFGASEQVDVFFGATHEVSADTAGAGTFGPITVRVPASAVPGTYWVSATGQSSGLSVQKRFIVRTNWAAFRFSSVHRGFNRYENVLSPGNVGGLVKAWSFRTGLSRDEFSAPAVSGGMVYVGAGRRVYALDAATGAERWSRSTGSLVVSSPAVADGVVYMGSWDHNLYAFDAGTGAKVWSYQTEDAVTSSPAVADGVVYVGSHDGYVYALDAATGAKLWSYQTGAGIDSSPAVAAGKVYIGSWDHDLYALDAGTGVKLWSYQTGDAVYASPAVAARVVYSGQPTTTCTR